MEGRGMVDRKKDWNGEPFERARDRKRADGWTGRRCGRGEGRSATAAVVGSAHARRPAPFATRPPSPSAQAAAHHDDEHHQRPRLHGAGGRAGRGCAGELVGLALGLGGGGDHRRRRDALPDGRVWVSRPASSLSSLIDWLADAGVRVRPFQRRAGPAFLQAAQAPARAAGVRAAARGLAGRHAAPQGRHALPDPLPGQAPAPGARGAVPGGRNGVRPVFCLAFAGPAGCACSRARGADSRPPPSSRPRTTRRPGILVLINDSGSCAFPLLSLGAG